MTAGSVGYRVCFGHASEPARDVGQGHAAALHTKVDSVTDSNTPKRDFAIVGGPTDDGAGQRIVRLRDGTLSTGELRPVKEGQPITQELVRLHPVDGERHVCAVEVLHTPGAPAQSGEAAAEPQRRLARPARVATDRYRKNWGAIFDGKRKASLN
jgi:hypothetical protein